jgi:hypothetical protein
VQRLVPGLFSADLTVGYTTDELLAAGITPGSGAEGALLLATFNTGTCTVGGAACSEDGDCGINGPCVGAGYTPLNNTQVDVVGHSATAAGLTGFSTFALLSSEDMLVLEPGAGGARTDCRAEWRLLDPNASPVTDKSRRRALHECHDGDASCDADGPGNGQCTWRVAICFDVADPLLPTCGPGAVAGYDLKKPVPTSRRPLDQTNGQALASILVATGGTQSGRRENLFDFAVPKSGGECTPLASLVVPVGKTGTFRGRARALASKRDNDGDKLRLRCLP